MRLALSAMWAAQPTRSINYERMPVLLTNPADFEAWLSGSTEEAFKLARSYSADRMRIVQSGSERKDLLAAWTAACLSAMKVHVLRDAQSVSGRIPAAVLECD
jgi:putative SOS response-associated peptidase YedK